MPWRYDEGLLVPTISGGYNVVNLSILGNDHKITEVIPIPTLFFGFADE